MVMAMSKGKMEIGLGRGEDFLQDLSPVFTAQKEQDFEVVKPGICINHAQAIFSTRRVQPQEHGALFNKAGPSLERTIRMGSTSNGGQILTHGVDYTPDNSTFDSNQGLAETALRRDGPQMFESLEDPEYNDPPSSTLQMLRDPVEGREPYETPEYEGWVLGGPQDPNSVPMQLLKLADKEKAALSVIYRKAKVEGNCITTPHHVVVVKRFLHALMLSENGIKGVLYAKEYALLLSRLSRELRSYYFDSDSMLDPADYAGCLGEMLKDMEETWKILGRDGVLLKGLEETWGPDVCVYVRRATDNYAQCLLAAVDELNSC